MTAPFLAPSSIRPASHSAAESTCGTRAGDSCLRYLARAVLLKVYCLDFGFDTVGVNRVATLNEQLLIQFLWEYILKAPRHEETVIADEADFAEMAMLAQSSGSNWDGGGQTGSRTSWVRTAEIPKATSVHTGGK